ncbi:MAG TPA: glycosyltransferase family 2 protein [Kiloniellaceae bacterium]
MSEPQDAPLVSVIIPTFNREAELQRAVESVLAQDYRPLEIVVVDDGSTRPIHLELAPADKALVHWVRLKHNGGGATARNAGIDAAKGEIVAFLDSDDTWVPGKLSRQLAVYRADGCRGDTVYYCQLVLDRGHEELVLPPRAIAADEAVGDYLFPWRGNLLSTITLLMRRDLAARVRFTEGLLIHQDVDFCLRLQQAGARFRFQAEPLARWHADDRADRMSHRPKFLLSLDWLETTHGLMPWATRRKFAAQLAAKAPAYVWRAPGTVLRTLQRCWLERYISTPYALRLVSQFVVPPAWSDAAARVLKPALRFRAQ